jgi:agarase
MGIIRKSLLQGMVILFSITYLHGQDLPSVIVDINLDVLHRVGDQDSMDRSRFITIHSNPDESDWDGNNFTPNLRDHFLNGYDVYTGRSTGGITWVLKNQAVQDPSRPGHVLPSNIQSLGTSSRNSYAQKTAVHPYEDRHNLVLCAQFHPFWPDGTLTNKGWALSQADTADGVFGTATGEYMGLYTKNFFGGNGPRLPLCIEIINEPLWELVTNGTTPPAQCFKFHNNVAATIRQHVPDIPIGGYTAAFPDFDKDNFQRWHQRDKLFFDMSGEHMDFVSIHLYDFPSIGGGKQRYRKGSNVEATFDMMEHYSMLTLGKILPFEISEYGAQTHDYNNQPWTAYRDWLRLKSISSLLLSYLERPNHMLMTIPFTVVKAEWGRSNGIPYGPRLMRQAFEAEGETGDHWVYTELVLFYQLWSEVRGKRVDTRATDLDFLCDAYVDGNDAYIILSNLEFNPRSIGLNMTWAGDNTLKSVNVKHQYLKNNYPVLESTDYDEAPSSLTLGSEGGMVVKCTFSEPLAIPDSSLEEKYYATAYLQEIQADSEILFQINDVVAGDKGEAVLRLGIGRDHGLSLRPEVLFNDSALVVPEDFRGGPQTQRDNFFGVIEIPVPYELLDTSSNISIKYPDGGGFVSSVALQVFEQSREITRSEIPDIFNVHFNITDNRTQTPLEGAEVIFREEFYQSDSNGHVLVDSVPAGSYSYTVKAAGFNDHVMESFELRDNAHLDISMQPLSYQVKFLIRESELGIPVSDAWVTSGKLFGYSNESGELSMVLPFGSEFKAGKKYFQEYNGVANISSDTTLEVDLLRLYADAEFRITESGSGSSLPAATISLIDTSLTTNSMGKATFEALEVNKNYAYTVSRDGYQDFSDDLLLKTDSTINISLAVGLDKAYYDDGSLELYPVPVSKQLQLEWQQDRGGATFLRVKDLSGRTFIEREWMGNAGMNRTFLDIEELAPGLYLLSIQYNSVILMNKFLKQ